MTTQFFEKLIIGEPFEAVSQIEKNATYSIWRDQGDYRINWNQSANDIKRFIDAVGYPYEGASTLLNHKVIRIVDAEIEEDVALEIRHVGKVLFVKDNFPIVICATGLLRISEAYYSDTKESIIPLKKFRSRFV